MLHQNEKNLFCEVKQSCQTEMDAADLERKRQMHRDAMRRYRQRHSLTMDDMRATVQQLTRHFQQLEERAGGGHELLRGYQQMARTLQRLKEEQRQLQGSIVSWGKVMERLIVLMTDHPLMPAKAIARQLQDPTETVPFKFQALSESDIQHVIRRCCVNLRLKQSDSSPAKHTSPSPALSKSCMFGWTISCDLSNECDVFVSLTKRLPDITAEKILLRTWETTDNPALYPHVSSFTEEVVQVLPERAYIEVLDVPTFGRMEGRTLRCCLLNSQVKTEHGYAVAVCTVSPELCPKSNKRGEFVDHFSWTDIADDVDGSCVVTVTYRGRYNSGNSSNRRFINLLSSIRRWEDLVMEHPLKLLE